LVHVRTSGVLAGPVDWVREVLRKAKRTILVTILRPGGCAEPIEEGGAASVLKVCVDKDSMSFISEKSGGIPLFSFQQKCR
jgi:hypothetical protein